MNLDLLIVVIYLLALLVTGAILARKAGRSSEDYFLGGRRLPWWALGTSGMSSNLDVAGTMAIVTAVYLFGLHGFFIEMRGGVVLPIAVFLAFMGKWHRRSGVMTTGEWMALRFGEGSQGGWARATAALTYLVITVGMVGFFVKGGGKFLAVFLPFTELQCQVAILVVAVTYTLASGLYGVIWTDVVQTLLIGGAAIYIAVIGASVITPELLASWPGAVHNSAVPSMYNEGLLADHGGARLDYRWFGLFLAFWIGKSLLEGLGGSGGSAYMAQRFYAARNEQECAKIGMLWALLFSFRWPMVVGFCVLAIHLGIGAEDPEAILPGVINSEFFPPGIRGLVIAALLAAAMSTFDSTLNAGSSYVVRDFFLPFRPSASERAQVWVGYISVLGIVLAGLGIALLSDNVISIWTGIVINLFPAFIVPFALRWFWPRLNGGGFSLGIAAGYAAALAVLALPLLRGWNEAAQMGVILAASCLGSLLGTFFLAPVPRETLKAFYEKIRPLGPWPTAWRAEDREEHRGDILRLLVALVWQVSMFLLPMCAMLRMVPSCVVLGILWLLTGGWLWRDVFRNQKPLRE